MTKQRLNHVFFIVCAIWFFVFPPHITPAVLHADTPDILPFKKRAEVIDNLLKTRLESVLPQVMRRAGIDMWLVICREYNEDPVFLTLVPSSWYAARRTTMLVFFDRGKAGVERLIVRSRARGDFYKAAWSKKQTDQWRSLSDIIAQRNPKRIGINTSDTFALGDGLTASLRTKLIKNLDKKYTARLCSAENIAVGWLETRTPQEMEIYDHIVAIAHTIIAEAFSNRVITPGVTSTQDVQWWMREKVAQLGLKPWFHPWVDLQRNQKGEGKVSQTGVIHRGDLLHCDLGVTYLRLNTDTQQMAYVLKAGETDAPEGLKEAMQQGNRLQDIFTAEFKTGITGNQLLKAALDKSKKEGLRGMIYTHPLGFHGHAAGPTIGLWDRQGDVPGAGEYPLYLNTCYAIELNVRAAIPEWDGQVVRIGLEQDGVFLENQTIHYLDQRQTTYHLIN